MNKILWPGWETVRKIGSGSFGAVYEINRTLPNGKVEKAALKVISIPQSEGDIDELYSNGYDDASITAHFKSYLSDIVDEYSLMSEIKGHTNVVYCDDIRYIQHDDGFGWDIFIKMELLTPLSKIRDFGDAERTAVKLAHDICSALVLCRQKNIIHRDIKPQNIFVSESGDYKLGDFGIARTVERTTGCANRIGALSYIAPEVYNCQPYGAAADIYSLGLVMYWLLNERRLPFLPMPPKTPNATDTERARMRRFHGEAIPAPKNGSRELKRIVLKACAYDPADRYHTADEMLADLTGSSTAEKPLPTAPVLPVAKPEPPLPAEAAEEKLEITADMTERTMGARGGASAAGHGNRTGWNSLPDNREEDDETVSVFSQKEDKEGKTISETDNKTESVFPVKPSEDSEDASLPSAQPKKKLSLAVIAIVLPVSLTIAACVIQMLYIDMLQPMMKYNSAKASLAAGRYAEAYIAFSDMKGYKDVDALLATDENLISAAARDAAWQPGKYVTFGTYPQTAAGTDNTPIEWKVLARDGHTALVISRFGLDAKQYHNQPLTPTWQKSYIRAWLNGAFLNAAFTAEEQKGIVTTKISMSSSSGYSGGADTEDKIWLLSREEAKLYFKDNNRSCTPTDYAIANGANGAYYFHNAAFCWLLRTSSDSYWNGILSVNYDGSFRDFIVNDPGGVIRPAMWIDLDSGIF